MLPAIFLGALFLLPAWLLRRGGQGRWAWIPVVTTLFIWGTTMAIKVDMERYGQANHDLAILLAELSEEELWTDTDLSKPEQGLLLASTASEGLRRGRERLGPGYHGAIDSTLGILAAYVSGVQNFRQWRYSRTWGEEVFFVAHAAVTLANYQLATGRETYADDLQKLGRHLGRNLQVGRYKHFISRSGETFYRPADNAAALYALRLHDLLFATQYSAANLGDWEDYLAAELYHAESRLPCAAFNATDRCHLEPNATATGLYVIYRALAQPAGENPDDIPFREWLHYFKRGTLSPFSMSIRANMRDDEAARFCELGALPLGCERYENAIGLWAARQYDAEYSYFRLYGGFTFQRWFGSSVNYGNLRPIRRREALLRVAIRAAGAQ